MKHNKIVFLTYHNWDTRRKGGFHEFAEAATQSFEKVLFFSFPRGYYTYFKKDERLNKKVLLALSKGKNYTTQSGKNILNITLPTLDVPGSLRKFLSKNFMHRLTVTSLKSKSGFFNKYFSNTDVFVFESNDSILLFEELKTIYPNAIFVYRPSDPLIADLNNPLSKKEIELLPKFDKVAIVNKDGLNLYRRHIQEFDKNVNYQVLPNGVNLDLYREKYIIPKLLKDQRQMLSAVYIGARDPEWNLIVYCAEKLSNIHFYIITPFKAPSSFLNQVEKLENLDYIAGIDSHDVPSWITNIDFVLVPNPTDRYKDKPWGITAKYYQAMAAKKPIISYHDTALLRSLNIPVAKSYEEFYQILKSQEKGDVDYGNFLSDKDWVSISKKFFNYLKS